MTVIRSSDSIQTIRDALMKAQVALSRPGGSIKHLPAREVLQRLINDCERQRPLRFNGEHHVHTLTCGCRNNPEAPTDGTLAACGECGRGVEYRWVHLTDPGDGHDAVPS